MTLPEILAYHGRFFGKTWLAAYRRGVEDGRGGIGRDGNPYKPRGWGVGLHTAWVRGWRDATEQRIRFATQAGGR
jgi:hypothetical protein